MVEPRHIQMVQDCIEQGRLLAVSLIDIKSGYTNLRNSPRAVCTVGEPVIVSNHEDGSVKILLRGRARVKLLSLKQSIPYMIYSAEEIPDIQQNQDLMQSSGIEHLRNCITRWAKENVEDSLEREVFLGTIVSAKHVVDAVSMYMVMDPEIRQLLLENVHLQERIQMLSTLFHDESVHEDATVADAIKNFEAMEGGQRKVAH